MSEVAVFCNKCGFRGRADWLGLHSRPIDGQTCNYAAQTCTVETPMTDQDHAKIVREANPWQPFSTAPKDGSWIIAFCDGKVLPVKWEEREDDDDYSGWCEAGSGGGGVLYSYHYRLYATPTHWMPLPPAPEVTP